MTTTLDLEALLESLPDGVLVADADGRYVYANQAGLELLGYGLDELRSMKVSDLLDTSPEWPGIDLRNLTEGRSWRGRVGLRRKGGGTVLVELVAAILPGPEGNLSVTSVRPIGPRPWREATSAVQYAVAEILAQARTGEEAAPRLLEALAEEIGWDTAEFWVVEEDGEHLRCVGVWSTPELAEFERVTRTMLLTRGAPLPGTVWETEAPMWIEDGLASMPFVRQGIAVQHGLSSACAVPVRAPERGIVGVLAFFARGVRREDPELLRALEPLTAQVGHFLHRRLTEQALGESRDQLQAILGGIEDGITVQAPDGSLSFANQGAARALGFETPEELLAMPVPELMTRFQVLDEEGGPFPLERLPGRRALQGERNAAELVRFRVVATGEERWSYVSASPVVDERGEVRFAINIFRDVTERRRIEEGQRFLGEASAILASSLHYQTTLRSVAELAVSRLADWCVVFIQEEGELRQLQVAHADPAMTPIVEEIQRRYPFSERRSEAILEVAGTGRSLLVPEITYDALAASAVDEEHLQALRGLGF
ncbi:MAG: PAS domain-containing protein, partial [Actinomycetota bacterium]